MADFPRSNNPFPQASAWPLTPGRPDPAQNPAQNPAPFLPQDPHLQPGPDLARQTPQAGPLGAVPWPVRDSAFVASDFSLPTEQIPPPASAGQAHDAQDVLTLELELALMDYLADSKLAEAAKLSKCLTEAGQASHCHSLDLSHFSPEALLEVPAPVWKALRGRVDRLILPPDTQGLGGSDRLQARSGMNQPAPQGSPVQEHLLALLRPIVQALSGQQGGDPHLQQLALRRAVTTLAQDMRVHQFETAITNAAEDLRQALHAANTPPQNLVDALMALAQARLPAELGLTWPLPATGIAAAEGGGQGSAQATAQATAQPTAQAAVRRVGYVATPVLLEDRMRRLIRLHQDHPDWTHSMMTQELNRLAATHKWPELRENTVLVARRALNAMKRSESGPAKSVLAAKAYRLIKENPQGTPAKNVRLLIRRNPKLSKQVAKVQSILGLARLAIQVGYLSGPPNTVGGRVASVQVTAQRNRSIWQQVVAHPELSQDALVNQLYEQLRQQGFQRVERKTMRHFVQVAREILQDRDKALDDSLSRAGTYYALLRDHPQWQENDPPSQAALNHEMSRRLGSAKPGHYLVYRTFSLLALQPGGFDRPEPQGQAPDAGEAAPDTRQASAPAGAQDSQDEALDEA